ATTEAVRDLPYGLLCEPHDDWFLFRGTKQPVEFVRILRRCSPRPLTLRERLRVLLAVAEPKSADVPPFDAPGRLRKLAEALGKDIDFLVCGPDGAEPLTGDYARFTKTTRDQLRKALAGEFDVFHLLAHGHGAGVLLCTADGKPAETTASELGEWCGAGKSSLAFLQVCKAGQTAGRGGFGGVAQQLLSPRGGNLAAVVASTFPLDAEHSTDAAVGFYQQLAAGKPPEEALTADRPESDWCWAFLELWARPGALGGGTQRAAFQFVSPYRGLSSFAEQDADLFFGRKSEVAELLQVLRAEPALAVVGDSGSGKTSLLQAGLVHAIRREGMAGSDRWKIVSLRPGYRPAQALLNALTGTPSEPTPEALAKALRADAQPLLVVFDQFEEVFTLARDKAEVQTLTTALAEAVESQRDRFRLILGMRSEFLGQAASVKGLSRLIRRPWVLRPPGGDDLRAIVAGPAEHCGYSFAPGLLDRILADPLLAPGQGGVTAAPLPLLQFALERLWLKAVEKGVTEFTHAEFDEIGGMGKAIAQHAEAVFQGSATATEFGAQGRQLAEQIITSLVSAQGTRQPRVREALQAETGHPEAARAVVDYLVGERLLTIRSDQEDITKSLVDLSHEALIENWDRLRGWLAEDPQGRALREEFRTAAEKWEAGVAGVPPRSRHGLPGSDVARNY
ncbi:MAG TPA: CHAT domain-containing protein, partial [Gemmataceae bacterium]|nr:CHAT domain-containing protein [Gemmataceae bacterium]